MTPRSSLEKLLDVSRRLLRLADSLDVPDAPLGIPAPSSAMIASLLKSRLGDEADVIAHLRTLDVSEMGAVNIAMGLSLAGVRRLLLLRGDPPPFGSPCGPSPEDVASRLRSVGLDLRLGHLLSLAKPMSEVMKRVGLGADFYVVTRPWNSPSLGSLHRETSARGSKLYVYLVVISERNKGLLSDIPKEEVVAPNEVFDAVSSLRGNVDGVIVSSPRDLEAQVRALEEARRAA